MEVFYKDEKKKRGKNWSDWPKTKPNYLQFALYKENYDSTVALNILGKALGTSAKVFNISGTKDKRAATTQLVTAYHVTAKRMSFLNNMTHGIKVGNFKYVEKSLKLGNHSGNHFTIVLKVVSATEELLHDACQNVKKNGFINYFGTQRFGTTAVSTHSVGRFLLQSDWEKAIMQILMPRACESEGATRARKHFAETGDAQSTLNIIPPYMHVEKMLLNGIRMHGKTLQALFSIPNNLRLMYVHAYQSWIWNMAVSKRIEIANGVLEPMIGDIVLHEREYIYITEENKAQFAIQDVLIPLPGYNVKYPKNVIGDFITEMMAKDNLDPLDMKRSQHLFSLPGNYRKILTRSNSFEYRIQRYSDPTATISLTDKDKLENVVCAPSVGPNIAIVLDICLDSGNYATMLIREITKSQTSKKWLKDLQAQQGSLQAPTNNNSGAKVEEMELL